MDVSRLTPRQIDMQMKKERYQKRKEENEKELNLMRDRQETQNGTSYRGLHDIIHSNLCKTVQTTLQKNLDKEIAQKKFNTFLSDASPNEVKSFNKKI